MSRGAAGAGSSWSRQSTPGAALASAALLVLLGACGGGTSIGAVEAGAGTDGGGDTAIVPADAAAADTAIPIDTVALDVPASQCDACGAPNPDALQPDGPAPIDTAPGADRPPSGGPGRDLDILFLIDNSPSMMEEQSNLRKNFPVLIEELKKIPGGLPNVHIAVASSDVGAGSKPLGNGGCPRPGGDRGIFQAAPNCGLQGTDKFMVSLNNGTNNNFQGSMESVFSCIANLGTFGCGYEHQLQATRVALYESVTPENKGFLRQDALLAIILITDEDDCSADPNTDLFVDDTSFPMTTASFRCSQVGHVCSNMSPPLTAFDVPLETCQANPAGRLIKVNEIVDSVRALKRNPSEQIMVAGIFGWPQNTTGARYRYVPTSQGLVDVAPICQSVNGSAAVGLRLKAFVDAFGALGSFHSICNDDFSPALRTIGQAVAKRF